MTDQPCYHTRERGAWCAVHDTPLDWYSELRPQPTAPGWYCPDGQGRVVEIRERQPMDACDRFEVSFASLLDGSLDLWVRPEHQHPALRALVRHLQRCERCLACALSFAQDGYEAAHK